MNEIQQKSNFERFLQNLITYNFSMHFTCPFYVYMAILSTTIITCMMIDVKKFVVIRLYFFIYLNLIHSDDYLMKIFTGIIYRIQYM